MATEKKLGDELLMLSESESGGAGPDIERIRTRERLRVRLWAIGTAVLWIITAGYLVALLLGYLVLIHPALHEHFTYDDADPAHMERIMAPILLGLKALLVWPILLLVSAACTTGLVLASRRATLRQIQASLARISEQLRTLTTNP